MARPTKLNKDKIATITNLIKAGNSKRCAAMSAGIAACSFYAWMKKGETQKTGIYVEFRDAVLKAEQEAEAWHVANIRKAASNGSWQASAWWLERVVPDRYGRWQPRQKEQEPVRLTQKERAALAGNDKSITSEDATVVWKRQLMLLEKAYLEGKIDNESYFRSLHSLTAAATKMAELHLRGGTTDLPLVKVVLDSASPHIAKPRDEPVTIVQTKNCGDLIEVS